ncbi:Homeodomain-interacting protein kinase 1 [Channa argus]|uniref:Homeodomain-interacting protein kinase 1 n=1 Tax=Channa argus TaxID=215402 RepID=A0A6G1QNC7_CHAAH|nr:Homeodomain-interacting protein kinase 1 [Channa argus]KAK2884537.1 hypothetical protein Q8A73_021011 [Channa argus]
MEQAETSFLVKIDDELCSASESYLVIDLIGEGAFATVAKCLNLETGNTVAVKIFKDCDDDTVDYELEILEALLDVDPDKKNIIKFMGSFRFHELPCLIFEMLDKSIWDLMQERNWAPLSLNEIRPITQQILVAFDALKGLGIMHGDLKLDNVMLVNHSKQPLRVKLIDFGLAMPESTKVVGQIMQVLPYRAPEVTLGFPLTTAVDMWSIACLMAHMYIANYLFPFSCEYNWMKVMLHLLGQPERSLLATGKYTWKFFTQENELDNQGFRFNSPEEYSRLTGEQPSVLQMVCYLAKTLKQVVLTGPGTPIAGEEEDREAFLSFLKCCLTLDAHKRITPEEALNKSFITMHHLRGRSESASYAHTAAQLMRVCHQRDLDQLAEQPLNIKAAEQDDNSHGESQLPVGDHLRPYTAPPHGHDFQPNRPSGEKSNRPQSCQPAEASDKDSDTLGPSGYLYQRYTCIDEEQSSSQSLLSHHAGKDDRGEPHGDSVSWDISAPPSAATDLCDGERDIAPPMTEESSTTSTVENHNANTEYLSAADNVCDNGSLAASEPSDGAAGVIPPPKIVDVRKSSDGTRQKSFALRVSQFVQRVQKGLVKYLICGANSTD